MRSWYTMLTQVRKRYQLYQFPHLSSLFCDDFGINQALKGEKTTSFRTLATKSKKALQLIMITTYGVRQNAHSGIVQSQVRMDDLFCETD